MVVLVVQYVHYNQMAFTVVNVRMVIMDHFVCPHITYAIQIHVIMEVFAYKRVQLLHIVNVK